MSLWQEIVNNVFRESRLLEEGIDIDRNRKIVTFNPNHQDNVDTNDYLHPYIIENDAKFGTILSIFERKENESRTDGNPLVSALKGLNGWKFSSPSSDIFALLRRFVSTTSHLNRRFDTLLIVPSNNQLNKTVSDCLARVIHFNCYLDTLFEKMSASDVENEYLNYDWLCKYFNNDETKISHANKRLTMAFDTMNKSNGGIFSYKFIPKDLRPCIGKSLYIPLGAYNSERITNAINDKDVLVFDDTVTSGRTLSETGEAIRETFAPKSITFLTLFSPLQGDNFPNTRYKL